MDPDDSDHIFRYFGNIHRIISSNSSSIPRLISLTSYIRVQSYKECLIDHIISANLINSLVTLLQRTDNPSLQYEVSWILTNIASGTSKQTRAVVEANVVPTLIKLIASDHRHVAKQAVWALGNIAGDGPELRDLVIRAGIITPLVAVAEQAVVTLDNTIGYDDEPVPDISQHVFLGLVTWVIHNLFRNQPHTDVVKRGLPVLSQLIQHPAREVRNDAAWAICNICEGNVQEVIDAGVVPIFVTLLKCYDETDYEIKFPILTTLGIIAAAGNETQTDTMIEAGTLARLPGLLKHSDKTIAHLASWIVASTSAGNRDQIQALFNVTDLFSSLSRGVIQHHSDIGREAARTILNITRLGSQAQVKRLMEHQIMELLCELLHISRDNTWILIEILEGLVNILAISVRLGMDSVCGTYFVWCYGGLTIIKDLCKHEDGRVRERANWINLFLTSVCEEEETKKFGCMYVSDSH